MPAVTVPEVTIQNVLPCYNDLRWPQWLCAVSQEINEELGLLSSDNSVEEVLTSRVVRRRVIIQVYSIEEHVEKWGPALVCCGVVLGLDGS